ncbi:IS21 family transposase, partial [Streptomyces sp. NPDC007355]
AHRTHQQIIGERAARDHMALKPLPETPYLVAERHLRRHVTTDPVPLRTIRSNRLPSSSSISRTCTRSATGSFWPYGAAQRPEPSDTPREGERCLMRH